MSVVRVKFGRVKEGGEEEMLEILLAKAVGSYLEYCILATTLRSYKPCKVNKKVYSLKCDKNTFKRSVLSFSRG